MFDNNFYHQLVQISHLDVKVKNVQLQKLQKFEKRLTFLKVSYIFLKVFYIFYVGTVGLDRSLSPGHATLLYKFYLNQALLSVKDYEVPYNNLKWFLA